MQTRSPFVGAKAELDTQQQTLSRSSLEAHWLPAIGLAVLLGGLFAFLASGDVPAPIPVDGVSPFYWIGWSPLIGLAVFAYLLIASGDSNRRSTYGLGACLLLLAALISGLTAWGRTDDVAILTAIHLPFVVWIAFGWAVTKTDEGGDQFFAYLLKSVETVVAAGLYLIAGAIFFRLTIGIFSVLGVPVPKAAIESLVAFGLGVVPLLALASVYDPQSSPLAQSWSRGLARIVRILPRLMLPAAIGILLIYILWFVPTRFYQPFEDRSALIVYNATIVAIIAVMSTSVTGLDETTDNRYDGLLRYGILALGSLTLLLNAYALAAIIGRIIDLGITVNRHAVCGWNVVTLLMLARLVFNLWRADAGQWAPRYRHLLPRLLAPATVWAVWVILVLPHM